MSIVKVIELIGESDKGWEEAVKVCVQDAAKTVRNIKSVWVQDMQVVIENERVKKYRVNCKISFLIDRNIRSPRS